MIRLALFASLLAVGACEGSAGIRTGGPTYAGASSPAPVQESRWVTLAEHNSVDGNRQFINVRGQDAFRKIRIEASGGAPVIKQVAIEFSDDRGNAQVVRMDARLSAGQGQTIDLNGGRRPVQRIIVYTEPQFGGSYSVFGT